jgi:hypothetical protein
MVPEGGTIVPSRSRKDVRPYCYHGAERIVVLKAVGGRPVMRETTSLEPSPG